ncbi:MAG: P-loop NTPase [Verrucomicrobia bacterium]|nr:P-loop NTPase [Verrucomicrobiota bacterium]
MDRNDQIRDSMRQIISPGSDKDIVSLGLIKKLQHDDQGHVAFTLELTTAAVPHREQLKKACEESVSKIPWVTSVSIAMSAQPRAKPNPLRVKSPGLDHVKHIIAVSSCKGGVGKSTTAVNLAYSLAKRGDKVGLFDADIYGPSFPILVSPRETELYMRGEFIQPLEYEGVLLMSFGFVANQAGGGPAIMRGPMVTQVINQLLTTTEWGELDYLVIDMPPGTGDIQLTLTQLIPITAAVIVTTPQQLSFVDVVKGIQMFDKLKVPTVAVVENMSYFQCPNCASRHYIFGQGARKKLTEQFGIQNTFEIPLYPEIARLSDSGTPVVLADKDGVMASLYGEIASSVVQEISKITSGGFAPPTVEFDPDRGMIIKLSNGDERTCSPADLRRACRCAHCIEEFSGKKILDPASIPESITPTHISPMGNYAVAISWSDGHSSSIYSYDLLLQLAEPPAG